MLDLKNLSVTVEKRKIIKNFSYSFKPGKIYVIMGPNGSGKSSLAYSIMGHPSYKISTKSRISLDKKRIDNIAPEKRSGKGIFLSFQSPLSLSGVTVRELLRLASPNRDPLEVRQQTDKYADELKISKELLTRSLNEGASGGEKKKLETLQAAVLDKKIMIFDEIDTGVDVDALRAIATFLRKHKKNKTYILITHYNRILKYLKPDKVLILIDGDLKKVGDKKLASQIEKKGYLKLVS